MMNDWDFYVRAYFADLIAAALPGMKVENPLSLELNARFHVYLKDKSLPLIGIYMKGKESYDPMSLATMEIARAQMAMTLFYKRSDEGMLEETISQYKLSMRRIIQGLIGSVTGAELGAADLIDRVGLESEKLSYTIEPFFDVDENKVWYKGLEFGVNLEGVLKKQE